MTYRATDPQVAVGHSAQPAILDFMLDDAKLSIVIPAYNAQNTVADCIAAVLAQSIIDQCEIIVVDDGSTDRTTEIVATFSPGVTLLQQAHRGAAAARNTGTRAATGSIILFTDADCKPAPTWAATLAGVIRAGADGAKGTYRTEQRSLTARFVQAEYESKYRRMARLAARQHGIDFIDTYSAAYRRDVLLAVGGFDEDIVAVEDQELSFRLAKRGYNLQFAPEAIVNHMHADTPGKYLRKKFWIGYWKVRVAVLHPERIVTDSHTPSSIKAQMLLLTLLLALVPLCPFSGTARKIAAMSTTGFLATTAPFSVQLLRQDLPVSLLTPLMMALRALGLVAGSLMGIRSHSARG